MKSFKIFMTTYFLENNVEDIIKMTIKMFLILLMLMAGGEGA